ncbi:MAG TPA: sigma factor, partial [Solirubrobacterales bacterium]|nr:sigma factor [Solirubrobacterales bacterium]
MAAPGDARATVEAVWRIESARLVAGLARLVRDVGLAEDLAQDALVAALAAWPRTGIPDNPGAWLMATAKNRAIDLARRDRTHERKREAVAHELGILLVMDGVDLAAAADDEVGDDLLALMFTCC